MILQEMNGNGHWKILSSPNILAPAGEAITLIQALSVQPLAAVAVARLTTTMTVSVLGVHFISNAES